MILVDQCPWWWLSMCNNANAFPSHWWSFIRIYANQFILRNIVIWMVHFISSLDISSPLVHWRFLFLFSKRAWNTCISCVPVIWKLSWMPHTQRVVPYIVSIVKWYYQKTAFSFWNWTWILDDTSTILCCMFIWAWLKQRWNIFNGPTFNEWWCQQLVARQF